VGGETSNPTAFSKAEKNEDIYYDVKIDISRK